MNERIEELFKRAGGSVSIHNLMSNPMQQREYREIWNENIDRFAELIVRECGNYMNSRVPGNLEVSATVAKMKKHFGVEE